MEIVVLNTSQEMYWEERLRNDLSCVEWGVKLSTSFNWLRVKAGMSPIWHVSSHSGEDSCKLLHTFTFTFT